MCLKGGGAFPQPLLPGSVLPVDPFSLLIALLKILQNHM